MVEPVELELAQAPGEQVGSKRAAALPIAQLELKIAVKPHPSPWWRRPCARRASARRGTGFRRRLGRRNRHCLIDLTVTGGRRCARRPPAVEVDRSIAASPLPIAVTPSPLISVACLLVMFHTSPRMPAAIS
jgi:hypothetical protein